MKNHSLLIRLFAVVAAMMCALGIQAAEAYACYTPSNTTLTFYYDDQRSSRPGTTYSLNTGNTDVAWDTDGTNYNVTKVVFDPSFAGARPTTTCDWFYGMGNLESITGMSYLNTSEVTNMNWMFMECYKLTSLDLSHFNTSNVISMTQMFEYCLGLTSLDLSSFNTANVTGMSYMFKGCTNLQTIYAGNGWSTAAVTGSTEMFYNCTSLVGGQGTTYNASYVDKTYAHIDGGPSNPGYLTRDPNAPEAYASYHAGYSTLTFYYDNQKSSRPGEIFDLNEGSENPDWYDNGWSYEVTKVVFDPSFADARPTTTVNWFAEMYELTSVEGIENLNTSEVTDMGGMFWECGSLPYVDVSGFDTHNVTNMNSMFAECYELTGLDVSGFDTRNVTSMESMFGNCSELTFLDVSGFNTAKVTSMYNLFGGCGLTSLDLRSFDTHNVTNMCYMFSSCSELKTIYVGEGWTTAGVTVSDEMFYYCLSIVGGQGTTYDPSNPKDKTYAHIDGGPSNPGYFTAPPEAYACYTPSNTTLTFYYDSQRASRTGTTYDLNTGNTDVAWDTDGTNYNVTKVVFDPSFAGARPTTTCDWFYGMGNLESITGMSYLNTSEVIYMNWMFMECYKLTSLDLSHFNTSKVTWMTEMFSGCSGLTSLDLSSFNTANVTKMPSMFYGCNHLETIIVGDNWSTAAVTNSTDMFNNCTNLVGGKGTTYDANHVDKTYAHIDGGTSNPGYFTAPPEAYACYTSSNTTLTFYYDDQRSSRPGTTYDLNTGDNDTGWDTDGTKSYVTSVVFDPSFANARPTTTYDWFYDMQNLESITGLSYLNTSEVTNMGWMFAASRQLTSIDVSHFNTSQVTEMSGMFQACNSLTSLDLSSFNTSKVTDTYRMFAYCDGLTTIYVGENWTTAAVTYSDEMFYNCISLVGGKGTTYDANHIDKTYAHIDGGPSNPGYFTEFKEAYACYTSSNTTLTFYYDNLRSTRTGTTYDLNTGMNYTGWDTDGTNASVTKVVFDPSFADARPTTTCDWFYGMVNLQSIEGMSYLNTSEVTNMAWMFQECQAPSLDLSGFDTRNVTNMWAMFAYCSNLTSLDLTSFNTAKVTNMTGMFYYCEHLATIYVCENWTTAAVTGSSGMFDNCINLVGGQGTTYDANYVDGEYAHIDGGTSNPGYFTAKNAGLRGDVNGDGHVSIADVTALIDYLLSHDASSINVDAADCNQDTNVSIADVTALIDYLLSGAW